MKRFPRKAEALSAAKPPSKRERPTFSLPLDTAPMEARAAESLPEVDGPWQYEPKWDGFRCLAFKAGDAVELRAKSGKPLDRYFPEVVSLLQGLPVNDFVVDGELLIEIDGRLSFEALQMRLHPAASRVQKLASETPARLMLFDILVAPGGEQMVDKNLDGRREALDHFGRKAMRAGRLTLSDYTRSVSQAKRWLANTADGDTDGVVAKRLFGQYECGARAMVKVKRLRTADCVVGGFRYESKGHEVGSLLLGLYDENGLLNHVGFTATIPAAERDNLTRRLEKLRAEPGFTGKAPGGPSRWSTERSGDWEPLSPQLVVEVRFDHVSGGRFRHGARLLRWRPDKAARQCTLDQIAPPSGEM